MNKKAYNILIYCLLGLVVGISINHLFQSQITDLVAYTFIYAFGGLYALSFNGKNTIRLIFSTTIASLIIITPLLFRSFNLQSDFNIATQLSLFLAVPLFAYTIHCFHYALITEKTIYFKYETLFEAVWNTIHLIVTATFFYIIAKILILIACALFKELGYTFLWNFFYNINGVYFITSNLLFFLGIAIAKENMRIVNNLRFILLSMMQYLYPLLALITVAFFIVLCISSITAKSLTLLNNAFYLSLTSTGILFFNAYFQDGRTKITKNFWINKLLDAYLIALFFITLLAASNIIRHETIDLNTIFYLILISTYTLIYALSVFFSNENSRQIITKGNIYLAVVFILFVIALNNFLYSPGTDIIINKKTTNQEKQPPISLKEKIKIIDDKLKSAGLEWQDPNNQTSLPFCRTATNEAYNIGSYKQGKCWLTNKGKVSTTKQFKILAIINNNFDWTSGVSATPYLPKSLATGIQYTDPKKPQLGTKNLYSCRTIYKNKIHYGKIVDLTCNFAIDKKEIAIEGSQILHSK